MSGEITTDPAEWPMGAAERLDFSFDFTRHLETSETVVSVTATLVTAHSTGKRPYPDGLDGDPTLDQNVAVQWVHQLRPGQTYQLDVTAVTSADRQWTMRLRIPCAP